MSRGGGRGGYNFPNWNYGYTLGPPPAMGNGGYTQFYQPGQGGPYMGPPHMGGRGGFMRGNRRPYNNRGGGGGGNRPPYSKPAAAAETEAAKKPETAAAAAQSPEEKKKAELVKKAKEGSEVEDGQITEEKPINDILKGRHAIVFCNEQSKMKRMPIEWEQISETGPPHDKTFTWSLKMGPELVTIGVANSKKGAKTKAAEDMARKLDSMGMAAHLQPRKRPFPAANAAPPQHAGNTQFQLVQQSLKKARKSGSGANSANEKATGEPSKLDKQSQNNPISKLYEKCRQKHWPEPTFETVSENVLDTYKTQQGFTMKKTEFTIQCEIQGKKFVGVAMTKKEAKHNAAAGAWAEFGAGVAQDSIANMLQAQRDKKK